MMVLRSKSRVREMEGSAARVSGGGGGAARVREGEGGYELVVVLAAALHPAESPPHR